MVTRNGLKDATALKREKHFDEACELLRQAYALPSDGTLLLNDHLRLPMYLQLAGKADDGWRELNRLNVKYTDPASQAEIAHQMSVFLQNEGRRAEAVLFEVWAICNGRPGGCT